MAVEMVEDEAKRRMLVMMQEVVAGVFDYLVEDRIIPC